MPSISLIILRADCSILGAATVHTYCSHLSCRNRHGLLLFQKMRIQVQRQPWVICAYFLKSHLHTYIPRVQQCLSPRRNWPPPPLPPASLYPPPPMSQKRGVTHSPAGEGMGESQFRRLEKSLALCLLCTSAHTGRQNTVGYFFTHFAGWLDKESSVVRYSETIAVDKQWFQCGPRSESSSLARCRSASEGLKTVKFYGWKKLKFFLSKFTL